MQSLKQPRRAFEAENIEGRDAVTNGNETAEKKEAMRSKKTEQIAQNHLKTIMFFSVHFLN